MVRKLVVALILVGVSTALGATVLREPIAHAAAKLTPVFVTNDAANAVPVAQQGTARKQRKAGRLPDRLGIEDVRNAFQDFVLDIGRHGVTPHWMRH